MISEEKQTLRLRGLDAVRALSAAERVAKSLAIGRHLAGVPGLVFGFAPLRLEPDWLAGWSAGEFALPRVERDRLVFHRVEGGTGLELTTGPFGTREPKPDAATRVDPEAASTVLVPGLAFDRRGRRLGRGAGYYDRFLAGAGLTARTVGVCFGCQLVDRVPTEAHDVPLDAIVTEDGWMEVG